MFYLSNYSTVTHLFCFIAQDFFQKIKGFCSPVIFLFIAFSLFPVLASVMWTLGCQSPACYLSDIFLQVFLAYHCVPSLPFLSRWLHTLALSPSTELFHLSNKQLIPLAKKKKKASVVAFNISVFNILRECLGPIQVAFLELFYSFTLGFLQLFQRNSFVLFCIQMEGVEYRKI